MRRLLSRIRAFFWCQPPSGGGLLKQSLARGMLHPDYPAVLERWMANGVATALDYIEFQKKLARQRFEHEQEMYAQEAKRAQEQNEEFEGLRAQFQARMQGGET